ncbi:MAG: PLP-dependent cysteine synthase family protein [Chloroflexi bacterium]|nr:PLP-dependent cysteine synthase family protein [Chloroflexota bacterium]
MALTDAARTHPLFDLVGDTPMVEITVFRDEFPEAAVLAKLESMNPGGSIKDRPVARMLLDAVADRKLGSGQTILDSSSGNAGIAYAMFGAALGYPVEIVIPANASQERRRRLTAHGAHLVITDAILGYDEALREVLRRYEADPARYFFSDQYSNDSNWLAHYEGTAVEILTQAPEDFTHFVSGVGTGGTMTGVGRRLREERPDVEVVGALPPVFPGVEGLKPLGKGHIEPAILDRSVVDSWVEIDIDAAGDLSFELARAGIFAGQSSGAYLYAVRQILLREPRARVVTVLPDGGDRYISSGLWEP